VTLPLLAALAAYHTLRIRRLQVLIGMKTAGQFQSSKELPVALRNCWQPTS
jgi:hypothetical protein